MRPNPQFPADMVTLTEEILNGKLHFLCSVNIKFGITAEIQRRWNKKDRNNNWKQLNQLLIKMQKCFIDSDKTMILKQSSMLCVIKDNFCTSLFGLENSKEILKAAVWNFYDLFVITFWKMNQDSLYVIKVLERHFADGIYLFKVNNRNTRIRNQLCSKLTIKTPERRQFLFLFSD